MNSFRRFISIFTLIFFVFSIIFLGVRATLFWTIDSTLLFKGNALLFLMTVGIFLMQRKALQSSNPNVFVRSVMLGMMIKMLTVAITILVYVKTHPLFNRTTVFIFLFVYLVYLIAEVSAIVKLNKK
ncbi:hypothetical protein [Ferruginibacter albus]|uniref:hypothetical protein n=1 Tax=Ferruginibacter albus TaxID=2875540 RepID=UPI001CC497B7|nr:hypothetical protein [Ferruginibacter albus]UAY51493.1 hypothetical protein K9M53_12965 [Ferruginibacter albus]